MLCFFIVVSKNPVMYNMDTYIHIQWQNIDTNHEQDVCLETGDGFGIMVFYMNTGYFVE